MQKTMKHKKEEGEEEEEVIAVRFRLLLLQVISLICTICIRKQRYSLSLPTSLKSFMLSSKVQLQQYIYHRIQAMAQLSEQEMQEVGRGVYLVLATVGRDLVQQYCTNSEDSYLLKEVTILHARVAILVMPLSAPSVQIQPVRAEELDDLIYKQIKNYKRIVKYQKEKCIKIQFFLFLLHLSSNSKTIFNFVQQLNLKIGFISNYPQILKLYNCLRIMTSRWLCLLIFILALFCLCNAKHQQEVSNEDQEDGSAHDENGEDEEVDQSYPDQNGEQQTTDQQVAGQEPDGNGEEGSNQQGDSAEPNEDGGVQINDQGDTKAIKKCWWTQWKWWDGQSDCGNKAKQKKRQCKRQWAIVDCLSCRRNAQFEGLNLTKASNESHFKGKNLIHALPPPPKRCQGRFYCCKT